MTRRVTFRVSFLLLAAGCGRHGLATPATRDAGARAEVASDLAATTPDTAEIAYRESTQQFVQVSAGGDETCALKSDGSMVCWGRGGDFAPSNEFGTLYVPRPASDGWKQVSPGAALTCAIKTDDTLACWGIGVRLREADMQPPSGTYLAVDVFGPCAIRLSDGSLVCWGSALSWMTPVPDGSFMSLSIWDAAFAMRTDGTVVCWSAQNDRIMTSFGTPPQGAFVQVAAGELFACGLQVGGQVVCWGADVKNWAGATPGVVPQPEGTFVQIAASADGACGVRTDGTLACWGMIWGLVPPSGKYLQVTVGWTESVISVYFCALRTDGIVVCWGGNDFGAASPP